jgi:hypothetical protein
MNSNYETLPTLVAPATYQKKMRTIFNEPNAEGEKSLYPFAGIGIYDRHHFIQTGGFDSTLENPHWQLMDFGLRSHLWGEEIEVNLHFKLSLDGNLPSENYTVENSYRRFYLKNLAPVFRSDYAHLPLYRFPSFLCNSGEDIFSAWEEFKNVRKWVILNKYRWKNDARSIIKTWSIN